MLTLYTVHCYYQLLAEAVRQLLGNCDLVGGSNTAELSGACFAIIVLAYALAAVVAGGLTGAAVRLLLRRRRSCDDGTPPEV
jgi:hypothetical protein